ncbi:MAG TPA: GMC family oxidoreductase [Actinomycetota bacterium]|nr:GMC family oxidoreductase [Actinomycetota bacterium]
MAHRANGPKVSTMEALADVLVPPGGPLPGGSDVGAGARALELLAAMPGPVRAALRTELFALEQGSRLVGGGAFSHLSREDREAVLRRIERALGPLGETLTPLKALPLLAYTGSPQVAALLGSEPGQLVPLEGPLPPPTRLPVRSFPELRPGGSAEVDVVVVGSGAGGAPVARALARAGWVVAVVEEGSTFTREDFRGPEIDRLRMLYRGGGATVTVGRPPVVVPVGRAVGGTTVGNSGTCFRTAERVVASWRDRFGLTLSPDDLEPHYEDVEATLRVAPVPWEVMGGNGLIAHRGATALGIAGRPLDRNAPGCRGSGVCVAGCPVDGKHGVHLNYLPQAIEAGAEILGRCRVDRLLFEGDRAVGVAATLLTADGRPAGPFTVRARRGVVVAAGAPFTPGLLRRSGIRGRGIGRVLRIHPAAAVSAIFDEEIRGWRGVMQSYLVDALADRGIMLEATFPPPSLGYAEVGIGLSGPERKRMIEQLPNMAVLGCLVSDTSSGRVIGLGPGRMPIMAYSVNRFDAERLREGMLLSARILFAAGAREVHPMISGAPLVRSAAEAAAVFGRAWPASALRLTAYHPMGTARMGADPAGVLDEWGRVHGADRLVVADASVFPTSLGVNPQVTIMAFASRAAEGILQRW